MELASQKDAPGVFPAPLIINPAQLPHKQTFILLHGRGSWAEKFAPPLLSTVTSSGGATLQTAFPHAKLIFLTAARTRAKMYRRALTHQWFDHWHMAEAASKRQELMRAGLHDSCEYVHGVLQRECAIVGRENVVLWGLSQGCATSLVSLLTWGGEPFAAVVGMCGYLPWEKQMRDLFVQGGCGIEDDGGYNEEEEDNIFGRRERAVASDDGEDDEFSSDDEDEDADGEDEDEDEEDREIQRMKNVFKTITKKEDKLAREVVWFLQEEIDMEIKEDLSLTFREVPVFLGHGSEDEKVPIEHGYAAKKCLEMLGSDVRMRDYKGLSHWYSEDMLADIFEFLRGRLRGDGDRVEHS